LSASTRSCSLVLFSWAWILVLFLIPYLGFILYLMLGRPIYREKIFPFSDEEKISYQERMIVKFDKNAQKPYPILWFREPVFCI